MICYPRWCKGGSFNCFFLDFFEDRGFYCGGVFFQKKKVATAIDGIVLAQNDRLIALVCLDILNL